MDALVYAYPIHPAAGEKVLYFMWRHFSKVISVKLWVQEA